MKETSQGPPLASLSYGWQYKTDLKIQTLIPEIGGFGWVESEKYLSPLIHKHQTQVPTRPSFTSPTYNLS